MIFRRPRGLHIPLKKGAVGLCVGALACGRIGYEIGDFQGSARPSDSGDPGIGGNAGDRGAHPSSGNTATGSGAGGLAGDDTSGVGGGADDGGIDDGAVAGSGGAGDGGTSGAGGAAGSAVDQDAGGDPCSASKSPAGWVCIPPGTFMMGSPPSEGGRNSNEDLHQVTIGKAFWLKATEETQSEWQSVTGSNPSWFRNCGPSCPVETITWYQAVAYANSLSIRDGYPPCYQKPSGGTYDQAAASANHTPIWPNGLACTGYRLPTESEWEYAARAGTTTAFFTGEITATRPGCSRDPLLSPIAWYCDNASGPHAVRSKSSNPWGLYDVAGNVWEWVWDYDGTYPASAVDPTGPVAGSQRLERGGAWYTVATYCRSAERLSDPPRATYDDLGLRLARSLP